MRINFAGSLQCQAQRWRTRHESVVMQFTGSKAYSQRSFCERWLRRQATQALHPKLSPLPSQDFHSFFNNFKICSTYPA
ncbi:hypothetical protein H6G96_22485 [Nostoc sp. FACHB-892]|uniref:hypothetical protein n=1 Tax=Nostoc sp. FACHB-892 TaxID=2692843 RepID=UPI0016863978|nr:hypothetical protein [Nostoc sp. FACHB-892]MBD2729008.1 hypothetical protein [Nostoc sp. FACHB-892]